MLRVVVISLGPLLLLARADVGPVFSDFVAPFKNKKAPPGEPGEAL
ncbi:hypothetical protein [Pseudomonas sp.]|nr:hypothetical protein [Pseudomonas sp.]